MSNESRSTTPPLDPTADGVETAQASRQAPTRAAAEPFGTGLEGQVDQRVVKLDGKPNWALIGLGIGLVILFVGGVIYARAVGSQTTEEPPAATATDQTTTTTAKDVPSETILTAVLAAGAVLIITGALYQRISTIKVLGAEVTLTPEETNAVAKVAAEELEETGVDVSEALPNVLSEVRREKRAASAEEWASRDFDKTVQEAAKKEVETPLTPEETNAVAKVAAEELEKTGVDVSEALPNVLSEVRRDKGATSVEEWAGNDFEATVKEAAKKEAAKTLRYARATLDQRRIHERT